MPAFGGPGRMEAAMRHLCLTSLCVFLIPPPAARAEAVELRPVLVEQAGAVGVEYWSGKARLGRSTDAAPAGVELLLPGAKAVPVAFRKKFQREGILELGPVKVGALTLTWRITRKNPSLVERALHVKADAAQRFSLVFPLGVEPA